MTASFIASQEAFRISGMNLLGQLKNSQKSLKVSPLRQPKALQVALL